MSKNTNLSFLTDYITADITNGRIGINNVSPTVAFDVSGATRISGALTLTSTISNGTYTYTLPSATGTLALTSALSSYLPLSGGTLTGTLSGTSASFSGNTETLNLFIGTGTTSGFSGAKLFMKSANALDYNGAVFQSSSNSNSITIAHTGTIGRIGSTYGTGGTGTFTDLAFATSGIDRLTIASTGAATFSSSVTAGGWISTANNFGLEIRNAANTAGRTAVKLNASNVLLFGQDSDITALTLGVGSEQMRITSAGNVGIGTSSPSSAGGGYTGLDIRGSGGGSLIMGSTSTLMSYIYADAGGLNIQTTGSIPILFIPGGSERMRITSGGNLLINKTSASGYPLEVEVFSDGNLAYFTRQGANTKMFMGGTTAGATAFYIQSNTTNGVYLTAGGTSWTANSDIRLKNIISPIDSAVDKLTTLNPVIFSWKSDDTNKENIGLIAQDVANVFPQAIDTNEDGFLGVRYVELVPVLVKAIQEQQAQIEELKTLLKA